MADIKAATNEKVFQIAAFRGLNQNPDGDTKLKLGEASVMDNFRITRDGNLQRRPGTKTVADTESNASVKGLWVGHVNGLEYMLGACDGKLYKFWDEANGFGTTVLGAVSTAKDVFMFGFSNIVYILDGDKYRQWDGSTLKEVEGYVPLVMISIPPENGSGESATLENVNRLTAKRRVWLSPDGTGTVFKMPEQNIRLRYVKDLKTGEDISPVEFIGMSDTTHGGFSEPEVITNWRFDQATGTLTFTVAPDQAVDSIEVCYIAGNDFRSQVDAMSYAELYSGTQDTRIFLYGDGTNKTIYSGIDYNGEPRADYFPDLYEALVGDENTPITGMIRHHSALICFKEDSTWSITAGTLTLADNLSIPSFYITPINKIIGMEPFGQARLVLNSPFTLFGNDLYEWKNSSYYTSTLSRDERQAKRISDRIWAALKSFDISHCYCYDDNYAQEYYICYNGEALVYNYAADAWSRYTSFPVCSMANLDGELYIGTTDGKIKNCSTRWMWDDGEAINAYWESGSMSFGQDYMRKYSALLWVGIKPESSSEVFVTVQTDKSSTLNEKVIESKHLSFENVNFAAWNFFSGRGPIMKRLKIKAKKFIFYKLIFKSQSAFTRATIVAADIRVRYTGMAK